MTSNILAMIRDDADVRAYFGNDLIVRVFPFGQAPDGQHGTYAVYQIAGGAPQNLLSERPDMDDMRLQFDVYAEAQATCAAAATALQRALELHGHQVSFNVSAREEDANAWRIGFDFEFWQPRA